MSRVLILVEGQTEETFVRDVLAPDLSARGISLTAVLLKTKRTAQAGHYRGGVGSYQQVKRELRLLLQGAGRDARVTSMLDLYGLPGDFPGVGEHGNRPLEWVQNVERAWEADVGDSRFHAYLSLHEFEAFAFVAPEACTTVFTPEQAAKLSAERDGCGGEVEAINHGKTSHPSARVRRVFPGYDKTVYGALVTLETGLDRLARASPHFGALLTWLRAG